MPSKSSQDSFDFLTKYQNYQASCAYAKQWLSSISALARDLQLSTQYPLALTPSEQADVQSNLVASSGTVIITPVAQIAPL